MEHTDERKYLNCSERFIPYRRNQCHQRYCSAPACRAASKRASQARWLVLPENRDYHCGPQAVAWAQAWRAAHPGYSRCQPVLSIAEGSAAPPAIVAAPPLDGAHAQDALSNVPLPALSPVLVKTSCNAEAFSPGAPLQACLNAQPIVLIWLISHLWGGA